MLRGRASKRREGPLERRWIEERESVHHRRVEWSGLVAEAWAKEDSRAFNSAVREEAQEPAAMLQQVKEPWLRRAMPPPAMLVTQSTEPSVK